MSSTATGVRRPVVIAIALVALCLLLAACSGGAAASKGAAKSAKVAFLLPENVLPRWENQDRPFLKAALAKYAPSATLTTFNAENDSSKQQQQAEQALTDGANVLVVIAVDQKAAGVIVNQAKAANVPVIAYDRLILNSPVDYYVSVDGTKVGELQGKWLAENTKDGDNIVIINGSETDDNAHLFNKGYMGVLQPLFDSGARKLVYQSWTPGWDPTTAQTEMEQALTKTKNNVQGVLSANDGMAASVVTALGAQDMAGKVPVTGLDGTTQALQLILQGKQGMTVYRSLKEQADKTGRIVAALLKGEKPAGDLFSDKPVNNGQVDIPWATVNPMVIDKTKVKIVMDETGLKAQDVCKGVRAGVGPC
jgi:D-xylose transport system substrate-binding protein